MVSLCACGRCCAVCLFDNHFMELLRRAMLGTLIRRAEYGRLPLYLRDVRLYWCNCQFGGSA